MTASRFPLGLCLSIFIAMIGFAAWAKAPLATVARVDLQRYAGTWYEIARLPFKIQEGCWATTATYTPLPHGDIRVENVCRDQSLTGPERRSVGKAWIPNPQEPGKLKVQFFWPFSGDYWILKLDEDYRYVLVGTPDRRYLWILSRSPRLDPAAYDGLVQEAGSLGFPVDKLILTPQP